jgi:hypothetical protein
MAAMKACLCVISSSRSSRMARRRMARFFSSSVSHLVVAGKSTTRHVHHHVHYTSRSLTGKHEVGADGNDNSGESFNDKEPDVSLGQSRGLAISNLWYHRAPPSPG